MPKVAYSHLTGKGTPKARSKALEWYRKTSIEKDAERHYRLGVMYQTGTLVKKDADKAYVCFKKAAHLGNSAALNMLNH